MIVFDFENAVQSYKKKMKYARDGKKKLKFLTNSNKKSTFAIFFLQKSFFVSAHHFCETLSRFHRGFIEVSSDSHRGLVGQILDNTQGYIEGITYLSHRLLICIIFDSLFIAWRRLLQKKCRFLHFFCAFICKYKIFFVTLQIFSNCQSGRNRQTAERQRG